MTDKKFNAILAKNEIAKQLMELYGELVDHKLNYLINISYLHVCLSDIEKYIGEGNQPSVHDIIK